MYIAGEWVESESGARLEATSPATGESLGSCSRGDARGRRARDRGGQRSVARLG